MCLPRNEVLVVLDHFYDVRVVHDAMRQRDLLDPQRPMDLVVILRLLHVFDQNGALPVRRRS